MRTENTGPTDRIGCDADLYLGDCRELLSTVKADLVLIDPPYGIELSQHSKETTQNGTVRRRIRPSSIANDDTLAVAESIIEWADSRGLPVIAFASPYRPLTGEWRNVLIWNKGPAVGGGGDPKTCWKRTAELIYIKRNGELREGRDGSVLDFFVNTCEDFKHHPCQKPAALLRYLIKQTTKPGDTVLDACMGSGSTGLACMQTGRKFIGIEVDPLHYETAKRRLIHATGSGPRQLFAEAEA